MLRRRDFILSTLAIPLLAVRPAIAQQPSLDDGLRNNLKSLEALRGTVDDTAFDGRPVLVTFFASWCPPCRQEMGELAKYIEDNGDKVSMIAVNWMEGFVGRPNPRAVKRFVNIIPPLDTRRRWRRRVGREVRWNSRGARSGYFRWPR